MLKIFFDRTLNLDLINLKLSSSSVFRGALCHGPPLEIHCLLLKIFWAKNPPENKDRFYVQIPFLFFERSLDFRDENHEIWDRFKVKTFFRKHFFFGTKIKRPIQSEDFFFLKKTLPFWDENDEIWE